MKEIKLLSLKLVNFKGAKDLEIKMDGGSMNIFGDNATGKTTIIDAFLWLLFGKNSENRKDFGIKTRMSDGSELSRAEHEVEGMLLVDGRHVTLRKVFHEVWTKPRGKAVEEFKGNITEYFIDELPVKASEYTAAIKEFVDEELFKLLTNPLYFNEMLQWGQRRDIIMKICGDITAADVLASHEQLTALTKYLSAGQTVEQVKKISAAKLSSIRKELNEIPIRISELQKQIPDCCDNAASELIQKISELEKYIQSQQELRAAKVAGGVDKALQEKIAVLRQRISDAEMKAKSGWLAEKDALHEKFVAADTAVREKRDSVMILKNEINSLKNDISACANERDRLAKEYASVFNSRFEAKEIRTSCPTCGQDLPEEVVEQTRDRYAAEQAEFNTKRAQRLDEVQQAGIENNNKKSELESELEAKSAKLEVESNILSSLSSAASDAQNKLTGYVWIDPPALKVLRIQLGQLEAKSEEPNQSLEYDLQNIDAAISKNQAEISELRNQQATIQAAAASRQRIEELRDREKELLELHESYARDVYLCDEFTKAKVEMLASRIEKKFQLARFTMFKPNITNSGIEECCDTTYQGVPYSDLNSGARINVGLDIIRTLIAEYGFTAPIFIDNAESVTALLDIPGTQMIRLMVSEPDKKLRFELPENALAI